MAQVSSNSEAKEAAPPNASNTQLIQSLSKAGLSEEQIQYLSAMTNSNETPDIALLNQLNTLASAGDQDKDPSQMNSEEMKQFSESIAQAADVVTNENTEDTVSLMIKEKTGNRQVVDDQVDIQTKENEIIKAEAANSAATGDASLKLS